MADEDTYGKTFVVDKDGFAGQEIDEFMEEMERRKLFQSHAAASAPMVEASAIHDHRHAGRFVIPKHNTWAAHRELVRDPVLKLRYSSIAYPLFDEIIHQNSSYRPIWDKMDGRYEAYDVLRENIAVVRNYIMSEFFPDGSADAEDMAKVKQMQQIASFLVKGMNNDGFSFNPLSLFRTTIRIEKANLPGTGAQYLYRKILEKQHYNSWLAPIMWPIHLITGRVGKNWNLPPLENSPFSDEALRQPPPGNPPYDAADIAVPEPMAAKDSRDPHTAAHGAAEELNAIAGDIANTAIPHYDSVDTMQEPSRREAVDLARDILRKLKVMMGQVPLEQGLKVSGAGSFTILDALKGAVNVFEFNLKKLLPLDPDILNNPAIVAANKAIGTLGYVAKLEVLKMAEKTGNKELLRAVTEDIHAMPQAWKDIKGKNFGELLDALESGMNMVLTRIAQVGDRASSDVWLGFSNANALGAKDPALQECAPDKNSKAMDEVNYNRQYNAQKAQQASLQAGRQRNDTTGPNASGTKSTQAQTAKATPASLSLSGLLAKDQMAQMRQCVSVDPKMAAIQVNNRKATMERIQKTQQQRQRTIEQNVRANKRSEHQLEHAHEAHHEQPHTDPHHHPRRGGHSL